MRPTAAVVSAVVLAGGGGRPATATRSAVHNGRVQLDGSDFLPWGVYMSDVTNADLSIIRDAGFNSVLAYGYGHTGLPADGAVTSDLPEVKAFLDNATAHSLQVFYAMNGFFAFPPYNMSHGENWTTSVVSTFKDHPAICAWYICDERPPAYLPQLHARHDLVAKLDPSHITYSVLDSGPTINDYTSVSEALGLDPYPWNPNRQTSAHDHQPQNISSMIPEIQDLLHAIKGQDSRTSICVTQIFGWEDYCGDNDGCAKPGVANETEPPAPVKRAMAFAALTLGCRGLLLYSYYDLYETAGRAPAPAPLVAQRLADLKALGQEIKTYERAFLEEVVDERLRRLKQPEGVISGLRCTSTATVAAAIDTRRSECTLFLVNLRETAQAVHVKVTGGDSSSDSSETGAGTGAGFEGSLEGYAVHVVEGIQIDG